MREVNITDLYADHDVEIGGRLYWDLDNDDTPDANEGVEGVLMNVTSLDGTTFISNVTSDENGVWQLFVPVRTSYVVEGSKLGFADVAYDLDGNGLYVATTARCPRTSKCPWALLTSAEPSRTPWMRPALTAHRSLQPASGLARDAVTVDSTSFDGTTLTWDAQVEPGAWVVIVREANPGENNGAVAIGLLDASVGSGGHLDQTMVLGGYVDLQTSWTAIDLIQHHLGSASAGASMISEGPTVTVELDDDVSWDITVNDDGALSMLVPSGRVSFSADMVTVQHELELNMSYEGSNFTTVSADGSRCSSSSTVVLTATSWSKWAPSTPIPSSPTRTMRAVWTFRPSTAGLRAHRR